MKVRTNAYKLFLRYEAIASDLRKRVCAKENVDDLLQDASFIERHIFGHVNDLIVEDRDRYETTRRYVDRVRASHS